VRGSRYTNCEETMKQALDRQIIQTTSHTTGRRRFAAHSAVVRHTTSACLVWAALTLSPTVAALEFQCEVPDDTRFLRVDIPGVEHLCEVSVTYQESGAREVMWYARNDSMFCSVRAYELRDKYQDLWNYDCTTWPDRDGINMLSPSQRLILDRRLKSLLQLGSQSSPKFTIKAVKAVASTQLDKEPGKIAFQFFTENTNFTEIIDDQSTEWRLTTTIHNMATQVVSDLPVSVAVVHSINDKGDLEVHTQLVDQQQADCAGKQVLTPVGSNGIVKARTPHRFVCKTDNINRQSQGDATSPIGESAAE